ncbi:hypothetical protein CRE_20986 [Caenorhabditis remanei]|uniref:Uncharacterized protein n=1 Tax=Caenorhabditis remanei TaxID=31234 RepID=E3NHM5_CAERE|nr:hypothetical protein CRE_20986 [Caenorhabditis remanei]
MKRNKNSFHRTQDACPIWHHAHRNRKEDAQSVVPPPPPPFVWGFFLPSQLNPAPFVIYRGSRWMTH